MKIRARGNFHLGVSFLGGKGEKIFEIFFCRF